MANLDDLDLTSITEMSTDEALEMLRQIRLSRRIPTKATKAARQKAISKKTLPKVDADQASELLKLLGGNI